MYYILLACGRCRCRTSSQLLLHIPSCICFATWNTSHIHISAATELFEYYLGRELFDLIRYCPVVVFFTQTRILFLIPPVFFQERTIRRCNKSVVYAISVCKSLVFVCLLVAEIFYLTICYLMSSIIIILLENTDLFKYFWIKYYWWPIIL